MQMQLVRSGTGGERERGRGGSAAKSKAKTANETQRNVSILIVAAADLKGPKTGDRVRLRSRLTDRE